MSSSGVGAEERSPLSIESKIKEIKRVGVGKMTKMHSTTPEPPTFKAKSLLLQPNLTNLKNDIVDTSSTHFEQHVHLNVSRISHKRKKQLLTSEKCFFLQHGQLITFPPIIYLTMTYVHTHFFNL